MLRNLQLLQQSPHLVISGFLLQVAALAAILAEL